MDKPSSRRQRYQLKTKEKAHVRPWITAHPSLRHNLPLQRFRFLNQNLDGLRNKVGRVTLADKVWPQRGKTDVREASPASGCYRNPGCAHSLPTAIQNVLLWTSPAFPAEKKKQSASEVSLQPAAAPTAAKATDRNASSSSFNGVRCLGHLLVNQVTNVLRTDVFHFRHELLGQCKDFFHQGRHMVGLLACLIITLCTHNQRSK